MTSILKKKLNVWTRKLSVGNAVIDDEHRNLISMINNIDALIKERDGSALLQAFEQLEHWLCIHFANEANIALAINYDFARHKLAEKKLQKDIRRLKDELAAKNDRWSEDEARHCSAYLKNWLIRHISEVDMQMKPALQNFPYDFLPPRGIDKCGCGCRL